MDVSNPAAPRRVSILDVSGMFRDLVVDGSIACVANLPRGLLVIDVSNPAAPVLIGEAELPGNPTHVAVYEGTAYLTGLDAGLLAVDVSTPAEPVLVTEGPYPYPTDVAVGNDVYVAGTPFAVMPRLCPKAGKKPPPAVSLTPVLQLSQNRPNPFTSTDGRTIIPFAPTRGGHVALRVFDVTGRPGRAAGAGIYFYRLEAPGQLATRRLVWLQ